MKWNPNWEVTLYRAIIPWEWKTIKPWDWVTFSKDYAKQHWESALKGKYEIIESKAKAKELTTAWDDLNEWWYRPNNHKDLKRAQLKKIREQANKWLSNLKPKTMNAKITRPSVKVEAPKTSAKTFKEATLTNKEPIKVYRGEGKGIGNSTLVDWQYFADSKKFAETFGKVTEWEIPAGSKIFDLDAIKSNPNQKLVSKELLVDTESLTQFLIDKWYDATKNTNTRGVEYVLLNKAEWWFIKDAMKYDTLSDFKASVVKNWDKYRDVMNWIKKRLNRDPNISPTAPWYIEPIWHTFKKAERIKESFKSSKWLSNLKKK